MQVLPVDGLNELGLKRLCHMIRGFSKYLNYIIWGKAILINKHHP